MAADPLMPTITRLELREALPILARRLPGLTLAAEPARHYSTRAFGVAVVAQP